MDRPNNEVLDITLPEAKERSLAGVFFKIAALPIAVFVVFLLGYLGLIGLKVEMHSILMLAVLLIIALILARHNAEYGCLNFQNNIDDFKRELKNYIVANLLSIGGKKNQMPALIFLWTNTATHCVIKTTLPSRRQSFRCLEF